MSSQQMWASKLGNKYPKDQIERGHGRNMATLLKMRSEPANNCCADCGRLGTVWSSVNLGVFTCLRCGSLHRALGTHVSKPKGCTGTYLWGPDEIARMQELGNLSAASLYGGISQRPRPDASDTEWLNYLKDKYEYRKWAKSCDTKAPAHATSSMKGTSDLRKSVKTADLLGFSNGSPAMKIEDQDLLDCNSVKSEKKAEEDFFKQFGV